jgi:hypothetical protein
MGKSKRRAPGLKKLGPFAAVCSRYLNRSRVLEEEYMATNNPIPQRSAVGQIPAQRKSWLGRNWKWLLLATFLLMVCFGLGIFALIMSWMRSSDVALEAVARAQADPAVVQRLGAPIEEGWLTSGSINVGAGGSGDADLTVPISGPKGNATVYVAARRIAGVWNYSQMIAGVAGSGEKIDLLAASSRTPSATASATPPAISTPSPTPESNVAAPAAAATLPTSLPEEGLGSGDGEQGGTRAVITDLKRGGSTVTLKFTIYNNSNAPLYTGMRFKADGYKENGSRGFSGIHLIDSVSKKKYFAVADSDGNCVCSEHVDDINPKTQASLWAKFPAPPENIQKITVEIPHFVPIDDVPIH